VKMIGTLCAKYIAFRHHKNHQHCKAIAYTSQESLPRAEQERPIHANEDTAAAESVTRHLEVLYEQEKQDAIAKQLSLNWMEANEPSENTERIQSNPLRSEE
jgi:hypothetical protein